MPEADRGVTPTSASPSPTGTQLADTPAHASARAPASMRVEDIVQRDLDTRTHAIVDALYQLASRAADPQGVHVGDAVYVDRVTRADGRNEVVRRLADVDVMRGHIHTMVPKDVIDLVDAGRNPDSHTRAFVNRLASENQYSLGQHTSIKAFRDKLGVSLAEAFPPLAEAISREMPLPVAQDTASTGAPPAAAAAPSQPST